MKPERIAKVIARSGLCSRREAERWITEGRISIDGKTINSAAINVTGDNEILVDGVPLPMPERTRLWLFHKPTGVITTSKDPENRTTIFDILPKDMPRVITIGRLDLNSEGLLLLTNNGELARHIELPRNEWPRHYRVRVFGKVDKKKLASLQNGITISDPETGDKITYGKVEAKLENNSSAKSAGRNSWLTFTLYEGKNREIRKICQHLGLTVNRLIRTSYGPFQLGKLDTGDTQEVTQEVLRKQIGNFL